MALKSNHVSNEGVIYKTTAGPVLAAPSSPGASCSLANDEKSMTSNSCLTTGSVIPMNGNQGNENHLQQKKDKVVSKLLKLLSFEVEETAEVQEEDDGDVLFLYNGDVCCEGDFRDNKNINVDCGGGQDHEPPQMSISEESRAVSVSVSATMKGPSTVRTANDDNCSDSGKTYKRDNRMMNPTTVSTMHSSDEIQPKWRIAATTTKTKRSEMVGFYWCYRQCWIWIIHSFVPIALSLLVWPAMLTVPLLLSSSSPNTDYFSYSSLFPNEWYRLTEDGKKNSINDSVLPPTAMQTTIKPLGLFLGIFAVVVGHFFTVLFFYWYRHRNESLDLSYLGEDVDNDDNKRIVWTLPKRTPVQTKGIVPYNFRSALATHLFQPEGFLILGMYLTITWMYNLLPPKYYTFDGTIQYDQVLYCLLCQDCYQYIMHRIEHDAFTTWGLYKYSHKSHHRFINPIMFDAFNGSLLDTILMILIPLYCTAHTFPNVNVWTYMSFGSIYANWLSLIHSEYNLPWDVLFCCIGFGTPGDHHVHHKYYKYNYGHLFTYWDQIAGTYRTPKSFGPDAFTSKSATDCTTTCSGAPGTNIITKAKSHNKEL